LAPPLELPPEDRDRLLLAEGRELAPDERMLPPEDRDRLLDDGAFMRDPLDGLDREPLADDGARDGGRLVADGAREGGRLVADGDRVDGGRLVADGERVDGERLVDDELALGSRTVGAV
jgi:hypothetical protein